jgi:hypothetical protein
LICTAVHIHFAVNAAPVEADGRGGNDFSASNINKLKPTEENK